MCLIVVAIRTFTRQEMNHLLQKSQPLTFSSSHSIYVADVGLFLVSGDPQGVDGGRCGKDNEFQCQKWSQSVISAA